MTDETSSAELARSRAPHRQNKEQPIKDLVVIMGSLMMFMCFGLLLDTYIREWSVQDQKHKRIAVYYFLALCTLFFLFLFYIYSRVKICRQSETQSQTDITEAVSWFQRYLVERFNILIRACRYLKWTIYLCLMFNVDNNDQQNCYLSMDDYR